MPPGLASNKIQRLALHCSCWHLNTQHTSTAWAAKSVLQSQTLFIHPAAPRGATKQFYPHHMGAGPCCSHTLIQAVASYVCLGSSVSLPIRRREAERLRCPQSHVQGDSWQGNPKYSKHTFVLLLRLLERAQDRNKIHFPPAFWITVCN